MCVPRSCCAGPGARSVWEVLFRNKHQLSHISCSDFSPPSYIWEACTARPGHTHGIPLVGIPTNLTPNTIIVEFVAINVYKTVYMLSGIRGELNVIVKLDLFSDFNKFRQSSCGIQFFCTTGVPYGYKLHAIHG